MDAQRKLSDLQTRYRDKELHYEEELQSQEALSNDQLAVETAERKRLAKELVFQSRPDLIFDFEITT